DALARVGLESWPLATGGKGLHVVAPLTGKDGWDDVKAFSRAVAATLAAARPDRYIIKASKEARRGKIFLDWLRNGRGATAVAPFSTRAREGAPVALPLTWSEIEKTRIVRVYDMGMAVRRLQVREPWDGYFDVRQAIPRTASPRSSKR